MENHQPRVFAAFIGGICTGNWLDFDDFAPVENGMGQPVLSRSAAGSV